MSFLGEPMDRAMDAIRQEFKEYQERINTLTAENAALRRTNDTLHKDWSEVNAENERLREALREVLDNSLTYDEVWDVARAALTPTDTQGKRDGQAD